MKNKIFKIVLSLALILITGKVFASTLELTYSDWSMLYPSGIADYLIEEETRYHFYKIENGNVIYDEDYLTEKSGYIRDDSSARTFFRYITNEKIVFNSSNQIVTNLDYCQKSFCYIVQNTATPIMMDISDKDIQEYDTEDMVEVQKQVVPFTGDNIVYYLIGLLASLGLGFYYYKSRKNKRYN